MNKFQFTEDEVRDKARNILDLKDTETARAGVGQLTSFNSLGFVGVKDRPDGWYLPNESHFPALILEAKGSKIKFTDKERAELLKNVKIVQTRFRHVIGILYNGYELEVYKDGVLTPAGETLKDKDYYFGMYAVNKINKALIYSLTHSINDTLHFSFVIKNLYHRMIFTACALVAKRYGATLLEGMSFNLFKASIQEKLRESFSADLTKNMKLQILLDVFSEIQLNTKCKQESIDKFIRDITKISDNINSDFWDGEDVMAIFFNEFNRYKAKSESGQVFTPDHITSLMYKITGTTQDDIVLDAACGSGAFLVKSMCNMIKEAGGIRTRKANAIATSQLYGIEYDREIFALACANMLIHKDGKTNLELMDSRSEEAGNWIKSKGITKVLMNPPFENKYGCLDIVGNVLENVPKGTICAFILPDNKLEKAKGRTRRWLQRHTLDKIIKLPKELFTGVTTSIFIFQAHIPQGKKEIFTCYIADDGLETIKNQGRLDIRNRWDDIESEWVSIISKHTGSDTIQWIKPSEHLSYQENIEIPMPVRADFVKRVLSFALFKNDIDEIDFYDNVMENRLYGSLIKPEYEKIASASQTKLTSVKLNSAVWKKFKINALFNVDKGYRLTKADQKEGAINYVGASAFKNGITAHIGNDEHVIPAGTISVCYNGSIGESFFQEHEYWATDDVNILTPKFSINKFIAMFFTTIIKNESAKYAFNNKWTKQMMEKSELLLPASNDGEPDFCFMEEYIKSLPYSNFI